MTEFSLQAGLNEEGGGLPSEAGGPADSEAFSFQSPPPKGTPFHILDYAPEEV